MRQMNQPLVNRLRACADDDSPNYDGRVTVYPPEARQLAALLELADALGVGPRVPVPEDERADVILADGTHLYWSTHCRHAGADPAASGHAACVATELAPGVPRTPARCKTCGARCRCFCHKGGTDDTP